MKRLDRGVLVLQQAEKLGMVVGGLLPHGLLALVGDPVSVCEAGTRVADDAPNPHGEADTHQALGGGQQNALPRVRHDRAETVPED